MVLTANACASGKTRYRKWFGKRITTAKRKWNASNDEKLQKADKTALQSAKGSQTAEKAESEKRGRFRSPIFHITCIIRNACNPKKQISSLFHFRVRRPVCECIVWNRIVLPVHLFLFNSGKVRPAVQTAAVCQSIHRSPHNKCVPLFYSLLRCRTVLHRLHSLQSTVLPIQPDSLRLLTM